MKYRIHTSNYSRDTYVLQNVSSTQWPASVAHLPENGFGSKILTDYAHACVVALNLGLERPWKAGE